jgi:Arc/MetJ family transcription regulator
MRTNIEIDDSLIQEAMKRSGAATKKAAVDQALRLLVQTHRQTSFRKLRGKVRWEGDLNQSRLGRNSDD